ncbi:twin-arginine translocation signal domain-containing protein, partial [Crossiella equi]
MNRRQFIAAGAVVAAVTAVGAACSAPWGSTAPTPPAAHARVVADGMTELAATEAQLAAAAANEPRREDSAYASNYFTVLAQLAHRGRDQASRLRHQLHGRPLPRGEEFTRQLEELALHYAALNGACLRRDITRARQARQAIATA